jgi:hypothetical protein
MQRDWKSPAPEGPLLVKMYLALHAKSAPTEQVVNVASRLISMFHTNLDPKLLGVMFFMLLRIRNGMKSR